MKKVLLHACCGPCSLNCIDIIKQEDMEPIIFWYNPNIHPFKEYQSRRDDLIKFAKSQKIKIIISEKYGLREFIEDTHKNLEERCEYCYTSRLTATAEYAIKNNIPAFTTTLLSSIYQDHEKIKKTGIYLAKQRDIEFLYKDFRKDFYENQKLARERDMYMQKYCGCIFSEEERYSKQILRDQKIWEETS